MLHANYSGFGLVDRFGLSFGFWGHGSIASRSEDGARSNNTSGVKWSRRAKPHHNYLLSKKATLRPIIFLGRSASLVFPSLNALYKVNSSAMPSELIVDFPKLECKSESSGKTVRFSPTSELVSYATHHKSDDSKLFYNNQDYQAMMIENRQVVIDLQKLFLPLFSKSKDHIKKVVVAKKKHLYAVLQEQARQDESGVNDPGAIARTSQQYSKGGLNRARAIGLLQSTERESFLELDLKKMLQR